MGDFNGDGEQDFVFALVHKTRHKWNFAIAVFDGRFEKRTAPSFLDEQLDLSDGGLWVGTIKKGNRLIAGTFESDDCMILQPTRKGYVWKDCLQD